jgi:hypothetical protein
MMVNIEIKLMDGGDGDDSFIAVNEQKLTCGVIVCEFCGLF